MKTILFLLYLTLGTSLLALPKAIENAKSKGATATFKVTVVDDHGHPVKGVKGSASFWLGSNNSDRDSDSSDENGHLTLTGKSKYDGGFTLRKEGYYKTGRTRVFYRDSDDCVEETLFTRKWVPDYVSTEVLKKKRNPIPMYSCQMRTAIPYFNKPIGLDLKVADWVEPYGKGKIADVYVTIDSSEEKRGTKAYKKITQVRFEFPNSYNGYQMCVMDGWSEFISSYHVNLTRPFTSQLVLSPGQTQYDWFPQNNYLVFRVRSKVSPSGELLQCHYGKIYPSFDISETRFLLKVVFFNPTPNDTNLEFDPENNLTPTGSYEDDRRRNLRFL